MCFFYSATLVIAKYIYVSMIVMVIPFLQTINYIKKDWTRINLLMYVLITTSSKGYDNYKLSKRKYSLSISQ